MANQEQLVILRQGVEVWNQWRTENPEVRLDLRYADLTDANLSGANLGSADFSGTDLIEANLAGANLIRAVLIEADLTRAVLYRADLRGVLLYGADLYGADLRGALLHEADLRQTDLHKVALTGAFLNNATVGGSVFGSVDLSEVSGLDSINHDGPSTIGIDTLYRSQGNIPVGFLRGAGVPDNFITYIASLTGKAWEYYTCFISYSSKDQAFADRLHADLQNQGVRCWFAPKDMKIGSKIRQTLDEAIRLRDKLLLILSKNSIDSAWVETEVETVFAEERSGKPEILFPVRLDDTVMEASPAWARTIRDTRHIGDFTHWKDYDAYQQAFERLLRDLKAEGEKQNTTRGG